MPSSDEAVLKTVNVRALVSILQSIRATARQNCTVLLGSDGMTVRWEDDSKSLQSTVFLKPELFSEYRCPYGRKVFGLQFNLLVDALSVFSSSNAAELTLKYPGPNSELVCEMTEDSEESAFCTYARIDSTEMSIPRDLTDYWEDPASYFLISGAILKEAIEDLEWSAGNSSVKFLMQHHPQKISFSVHALGDLEISIPSSELSDFKCVGASIEYRYKYKQLRIAFSNLPSQKEHGSVASKVIVDSKGMMKVTHMVNMYGTGQDFQGNNATQRGTGYTDSQRMTGATQIGKGVVQFLIMPEEDIGGEISDL